MSHLVHGPTPLWRHLVPLTAALLAGACSGQAPPPSSAAPTAAAPTAAAAPADAAPAEHEHEAPHGGALVELGAEFAHVEFVLDAASGTLTGYVLDGEAERPIRITQPALQLDVHADAAAPVAVTLEAVANALSGETAGDTSQFAGRSDRLRGATRFSARLARIELRGRTFTDVAVEFPEGSHEPGR